MTKRCIDLAAEAKMSWDIVSESCDMYVIGRFVRPADEDDLLDTVFLSLWCVDVSEPRGFSVGGLHCLNSSVINNQFPQNDYWFR